ncbi:hypothetical protein A2947_03260 [Candidatus Peribacteria bacterium RIFCSPLOWO2_01_FULL_54_110]|nr:MAG: hypothetical protein A2947_03260 [Candidatus Peribacteria bacterium RIFCSPLOWO2_01_FULL_54_110]
MASDEDYQERFKKMTDEKLQDILNKDFGNPGWVAARGRFLSALRTEFENRDYSYADAQEKARKFFEKKKKAETNSCLCDDS